LKFNRRREDDLLTAEAIARPGAGLGHTVTVLAETGSTNDELRAQAEAGAPEGVVLIAEVQTRGRGRLGRPWVSPGGKNLTMSVLLRPHLPAEQCFRITLLAGLAVAETLADGYGLKPRIKWPNDVLLHDRKVCGILAEMHATAAAVDYVILGLGVNLNLQREELPEELRALATSVGEELGRTVSRSEFARNLLAALEARYRLFQQGKWPEILAAWNHWAAVAGQEVTVESGSGTIQGQVVRVDDDGALRVFDRQARVERRILAGDVHYLRAISQSPPGEKGAREKHAAGH
jgi:BirA family transcriptional regulator, biotin operon repressor / biotin---[acetyl-CoA-carboxylase] ligase